ncbi:hypothetical protein CBS147333_9072 [Penicillium roqueforti]|nr:hypothetical protein CBS147333_9072 [Penicillium roqueforti]KAI3196679.1 hypothetical protein CBS147311_7283 [Penicillium roqueforti]KAI3262396.1 hypothetical protein CBS147308_9197 [Penicillium roqueforti]KAI3281228.1 hypothetical protein DTO003C3_9035 [Penicillium roqueforti]
METPISFEEFNVPVGQEPSKMADLSSAPMLHEEPRASVGVFKDHHPRMLANEAETLQGTTSDQLRGRTQKRDNPPRSIAEAKMRSNRPGHTIFSFSDQNTPGFTLLSVNLETISHSNPSRPTTQQAEADSKRQKNTGSAWHGKYKNDDAARDEEARDKLKKGDKRTGN